MERQRTRLDSPSHYTIGWIAALAIEQAAARALLDEEHSEPNNFHPSPSDTNNYIWGRIGQHNIVIASLPAGVYGTTSAATTASDIVHSLPQIRFGLLIGIGGAIPRPDDDHDIRLGDVVVGQPHGVTGGVVQYDFGKAQANRVLLKALANLQAEHEMRPSKIPQLIEAMLKANPGMKRPSSNFTYQGSENDRLFPSDYEHVGGKTCAKCDASRRIYREKRETTEPLIHYGVIASGNTLIKDAKLRDSLAESVGHQCLCVEMETAGLVDKFPCLVIRGICDYADSHKNNLWQRYAASTAAAFAVELLGHVPVRQLVESPPVLEILQSLEGKVDSVSHQMQQADLLSSLEKLPFVAEALFNSYAEEHSPMCLPETRVQLLAEIDEWVTSAESKTIFWLNGMAGTGKSTVSRTVAQWQLERHCLGASFFFKRGEASRGNMSKLIPTLARQLAMHIPRITSSIKKAIDADPSLPTKTLAEQFDKLFKYPLKERASSSSEPKSLVIVIDALDECEDTFQIKRILSLFAELECLDSLKLRVFITSRPELPIQLGFLDINGMYQSLELHSISQDVMEHDISIFFQHELGIIRQNFNHVVRSDQRLAEQWPGTVKARQLVSMTQPLFIAAATVCRFLNDATLGGPDELLAKILESSSRTHMSRLNDIYYSILASQVVNRPKTEREEIAKSFQLIVGAIITLATPLTIDSLSLLLNIPATTIDMKIKALQSVLDVPKTPEVPVRILHLSFRDYLVDPDLQGATDFWVDEKDTHKRLTSRCLFVMNSTLRENMCRLPFPGTSPSEVEGLDPHKFIPPELHYACHYWVHHCISSNNGERNTNEIYSFLEKHLLHWLEAMSLLGHITDCLNMLHSLDAWLEKYSCDNLSDLVKDSLRFIRTHLSIIEEAPLQVYSSAIVFSPKNSIVRRLFASGVPNWLLAWPAVDDEWGPCSLVIGHSAVVKSAIFSPDSRTIASIYADNTIRILSTKTGKCEHVLAGHCGEIESVVFSQDSKVLASSSFGGTLRIWNLQTGECDEVLKYPSPTGKAFAFSRDSKLLLTACGTRFVRIWKTQTWDHLILGEHTGGVNSAVISHDSKMLATSSDDETVRLWNTQTGRCEKILKGHTGEVNTAAISPDNQLLVSASSDKTLRIWDLAASKCKKVLRGHSSSILLAAFSPDSCMIASGDTEGCIGIWDARNGAFIHEVKTGSYDGKLKSVVFSEDSTNLVAVLSTGTILIHDIQSGNCEQAFEFSSPSTKCSLELSHDFAMILTASSDDNTVRIWDPQTQSKSMKKARIRDKSILQVQTSSDGKIVVLHTVDSHEIWSLRRNEFECLFVGDSDFTEFSPNYPTAVVTNGTSTTMCKAEPRGCTSSFDIKTMAKYSFFSEDCKVLVTFHMDDTRCYWHLERHSYTRVANTGFTRTGRGYFIEPRSGNVMLDAISTEVVEHPHSILSVRLRSIWPAPTRDQSWIMVGNDKFFRLSPECLNAEIIVSERTVVIACASGSLMILSFNFSKAGLLLN
ncbi:trp-asp repeat containing protein [Fusarium mundagurra]|uniref:Trp-asp repeat containing protein n=1 Tax=Fusarium mundagurra TaxID=1567541 RepID=A0A8H5Z4M8_9HYPO|nr:trp-asp repeat containing protein [Fusarium mundagurra]